MNRLGKRPAETLNHSQSYPLSGSSSLFLTETEGASCPHEQARGTHCPALVVVTSLLFNLFLNELMREQETPYFKILFPKVGNCHKKIHIFCHLLDF